MIQRITAICLLSLLLGGCGAVANTAAPSLPGATAVLAVQSVTTAPAPASAPVTSESDAADPASDVLVVVSRSGGIAGKTDTTSIYGDGSVTTKHTGGAETQRATRDAAATDTLMQQITATGIYDLAPGRYGAKEPCCDRFAYDITLMKDGRAYQYTTVDGASTPPALDQVFTLVQQYTDAVQ